MRSAVLCLLAVGLTGTARAADDPIFSGPQVGEKLTPFKARGVLDPHAGKDLDFITLAKEKPVVLVFVHELTRPSVAMVRTLTAYTKSREKDGLTTGVVWLAAPWESAAGGRLNFAGVGAILCSCVFWSVGSIYSRHARHGADPFVAAALQMLCGGGALLFAALLHGDLVGLQLAAITARAWGAFSYLVLLGSLVGFSTFVWLIKHSTPARVATYAYVNPVVAVLLGWLILDEPITTRTLIASAIIVTAVVIITTEKSRSPKS